MLELNNNDVNLFQKRYSRSEYFLWKLSVYDAIKKIQACFHITAIIPSF